MSKELMVGSVYAESDRNEKWLELQLEFLKKTTDNFDHVVFCNNIDSTIFKESKIIESEGSQHHVGLNALLQHASEHDYRYCLLLDSDAFPFKVNWLSHLVAALGNYNMAAVLRLENLDQFPHPCVFFLRKPAMNWVRFQMRQSTSLLGEQFYDVMPNVSMDMIFPMIRTNAVNLSPLLAGIYWNSFYHHGAGSRNSKTFRAMNYYGQSCKDVMSIEDTAYKKLTFDPDGFLDLLSYGSQKYCLKKVFV